MVLRIAQSIKLRFEFNLIVWSFLSSLYYVMKSQNHVKQCKTLVNTFGTNKFWILLVLYLHQTCRKKHLSWNATQELMWEWLTSSCPWCNLSKYQLMDFRILVEDQQIGKVSLCRWTILQSLNLVTFCVCYPLKADVKSPQNLCEVKTFHTKFQPSTFPNLEGKQEHRCVQIASITTVCV